MLTSAGSKKNNSIVEINGKKKPSQNHFLKLNPKLLASTPVSVAGANNITAMITGSANMCWKFGRKIN
ncbi:MAG: hypothetical protein RIQ89_678 [Bacteroidota bacterium]